MSTSFSNRRRLSGFQGNIAKQLEDYGFRRTEHAQGRGWIIFSIIFASALGVEVLFWYFPPPHLSQIDVLTAVIALGALGLGFHQWCASRNEISLDRFYDRLEVTNRILDEHKEVRSFAGPWQSVEGSKNQHDEDVIYHTSMYVYRELDNLEYAIAKYKLGYMSPENALRSLRTFRVRCNLSPEFRELALMCAAANEGYDSITQEVVNKVCDKIREEECVKVGSQPFIVC